VKQRSLLLSLTRLADQTKCEFQFTLSTPQCRSSFDYINAHRELHSPAFNSVFTAIKSPTIRMFVCMP